MRRLLLALALSCSNQPPGPWRGALGPLEALRLGEGVVAGAVAWARGDTLGLTSQERQEFLRALESLPLDTQASVRALLRLAYRHGFGSEALCALGISLSPQEVKALLGGDELEILPKPPPPPEGPVAEAWPDGYLIPFLELSRWGFMLPVSLPAGTMFLLIDTSFVPVEAQDTTFNPPEGLSPEESRLLLPVRVQVFVLQGVEARLDGVEWCFGLDSVRVFAQEGPLLYARAWKGQDVYTAVIMADSTLPSWVRLYPPGSDVLSVTYLGALDLDGDASPEAIISEEGEVSRRWEVLKKRGPAWVSVYSYSLEEEVD